MYRSPQTQTGAPVRCAISTGSSPKVAAAFTESMCTCSGFAFTAIPGGRARPHPIHACAASSPTQSLPASSLRHPPEIGLHAHDRPLQPFGRAPQPIFHRNAARYRGTSGEPTVSADSRFSSDVQGCENRFNRAACRPLLLFKHAASSLRPWRAFGVRQQLGKRGLKSSPFCTIRIALTFSSDDETNRKSPAKGP